MFEKIINFSPAWDRRDKNCGVHGVEIRFLLKGEKGVIQFVISTNWMLPHTYLPLQKPLPADLGYHSPVPIYDGQELVSDSCEYLDGEPCYYEGSGLGAMRVFDEILLPYGSNGVWEEMEKIYWQRFEREAQS